jgi:hypothetical protein
MSYSGGGGGRLVGSLMITKHPWFGPKNGLGWGWTPVSWEGWLVTTLCLLAIVGANFVFGRVPMTTYITLGSVAAVVVICLLTGTALRVRAIR